MQVSGLQHPVVSARIQHARSETNSGFWPAPCAIGVRGADPLQSADEGGQEIGGRPRLRTPRRPDAAGKSEVYLHTDLRISRFAAYPPTWEAARGRATRGPADPGMELVTGIEPVTPSLRVTCSTS